ARHLGTTNVTYINCDLPSVDDRIRDPELFYRGLTTPIVVFDEIHQLKDPTRLLKIGADVFPDLKILATGSSTLAASRTFRDTLTGRKRTVHLVPVLWSELEAFGTPIERRLLHGGLPQPLLAPTKDPAFFREWMDSFFARDIQRLFRFRDVSRFNAVLEFMLRHSGGQFETTKAARVLGISRQTVESHLRALEVTNAITIVRPFHRGNTGELVKMPKVYAFDTGFVSFVRGWDTLRHDDLGGLWEHLVLEFMQARLPGDRIHYWRDKLGREVDMVIPRGRQDVDAIECKWEPAHFDAAALRVFRAAHPRGRNFVITPGATTPYQKRYGDLVVTIGTPDALLT
ncbi:MAG: DUF4143 domain-containing protein, partial [Acidobacteria bacterium]|nr:DUF4143 domain-containing protein [Acidobacteriota bacterium]